MEEDCDEHAEISIGHELIADFQPYASIDEDDQKVTKLQTISSTLKQELIDWKAYRTATINRFRSGSKVTEVSHEGEVATLLRFLGYVHTIKEVQHPTLKLGHLGRCDPVVFREISKRTQHIAHGVAQPAIAVRDTFQDFIPDPQVSCIVGLRHPKTQDIRAILVHNLLWCDGVADRFGHLHALLIQRKPVRQYTAIRRVAHRAAGLQHG